MKSTGTPSSNELQWLDKDDRVPVLVGPVMYTRLFTDYAASNIRFGANLVDVITADQMAPDKQNCHVNFEINFSYPSSWHV